MFIPIGTNAPLYHWPIATGVLIVANLFFFVVQHTIGNPVHWVQNAPNPVAARVVLHPTSPQDFDKLDLKNKPDPPDLNDQEWDTGEVNEEDWKFPEEWEDDADSGGLPDQLTNDYRAVGWEAYALWTGDGIHPVQWLAACFLHADLMHLIGNMIFFAVFGLIVEGRLGSWQFAVYYLTIGTLSNCVTQLVLLGSDPAIVLGASAAINGVMATAMIWSPRDNVICLLVLFFFVFFPRIPILIFGIAYVFIDLGIVLMSDELLSSASLHVLGAMTGTVAAFIGLSRGWVETDDGDVVTMIQSVMGKDPKKRKPKKLTKRQKAEKEDQIRQLEREKHQKIDQIWRSVEAHLSAENLDAAMLMSRQSRQVDPKSLWPEQLLLKLIGKLQTNKRWDDVIYHSTLYLKHFATKDTAIRLNLAKILLVEKQTPRKALQIVKPLESKTLEAKQNKALRQIISRAKELIDAGTLELGE